MVGMEWGDRPGSEQRKVTGKDRFGNQNHCSLAMVWQWWRCRGVLGYPGTAGLLMARKGRNLLRTVPQQCCMHSEMKTCSISLNQANTTSLAILSLVILKLSFFPYRFFLRFKDSCLFFPPPFVILFLSCSHGAAFLSPWAKGLR